MANAHLLYAHLGDNVFPSEGGKLNIIGIFAGLNNSGTIGVSQFPTVYPRLALAVGLSTTAPRLPIEITFRTEGGADVVPPFSGTFEIQRDAATSKEEAANVNFNLNFDAFRLESPGKLYVSIDSEKNELAELELNVVASASSSQPDPSAKS